MEYSAFADIKTFTDGEMLQLTCKKEFNSTSRFDFFGRMLFGILVSGLFTEFIFRLCFV